jgi:hypothetical protein
VAGIFSAAQPKYDALRIATFPFDATGEVKRGPLVSHYKRMGLQASRQMALRFADASGLAAMAGARNRFTVVDIDERGSAGERLLADTQRQFGSSKLIVRTGSGGFHAYYRHSGEGRKIRPDPRKPIDLIGGGPIVLPPSRGFRGNYEIIHGRLDDLAELEPIRAKSATVADSAFDGLRSARDGGRDKKFWPHVARQAHLVKSLDELIAIAREMNELMAEPWSDTEVDSEIVKRCKYWWEKTQKGENWFGVGRHMRIDHSLVDDLMMRDPDAFILLSFLRRHHWGHPFYMANEMHAAMPGGGWRRQRFTAARARLIHSGNIRVLEPASFKPNKPMLCSLEQPPRGVSRNGQQ